MRHNKYSKTLLWILFLAVFIDEIEGLYVTEDVFERANDIMCLFILILIRLQNILGRK